MRPLPLPRGSRGNGNYIHQTVLSHEHRNGLAPEERHVRSIEKKIRSVYVAYLGLFRVNRLTALFLATKTTNNPISLDSYAAHIPRTEPTDVLELEFLVAQSLGFDFAVWHPHRALWGAWLDLQVSGSQMFLAFDPDIFRQGSHTTPTI